MLLGAAPPVSGAQRLPARHSCSACRQVSPEALARLHLVNPREHQPDNALVVLLGLGVDTPTNLCERAHHHRTHTHTLLPQGLTARPGVQSQLGLNTRRHSDLPSTHKVCLLVCQVARGVGWCRGWPCPPRAQCRLGVGHETGRQADTVQLYKGAIVGGLDTC